MKTKFKHYKISTTILKLISVYADFVPDELKQRNAKELLNLIHGDREIEFTQTDDIEFIDQGSNFENVSCNQCGLTFNLEFWQDEIDKAYSNKFKTLNFITPCCNNTTSLNDLKYHWSAGFAKFVISITDPMNAMNDQEIAELEQILDTEVRKIWAHY